MKKFLTLIVVILVMSKSYGLLKIEINKQGVQTIPIAVAQFSGFDNNLADIIANNLINSGRFSVKKMTTIGRDIDFDNFRQQKIEAVVFGDVEKVDGKFDVKFYVYDIWTKKSILAKRIKVEDRLIRRIAHKISDKTYFALLGEDGFFDTNIAYVSVNKNSTLPYQLEVVDSDGYNPQIVLKSQEPILSPAWSPDNTKLAYVSFSSGKSKVYIQDIFRKEEVITLPHFDGIASSPSWHPDGESLLFTLSRNGNQDIYRYFLNGKLKRITVDKNIDTEAQFSPNGKQIVWTSNRSGSPQIYITSSNSNSIRKLSIGGSYNVSPSFSPNGKKIIIIHNELGQHKVAEFEIETGDLVILTDNNLDESPSYAPNGNMVIYSYNIANKSYLSAVSTNGNYSLKLSDGSNEVREPVWSGFL